MFSLVGVLSHKPSHFLTSHFPSPSFLNSLSIILQTISPTKITLLFPAVGKREEQSGKRGAAASPDQQQYRTADSCHDTILLLFKRGYTKMAKPTVVEKHAMQSTGTTRFAVQDKYTIVPRRCYEDTD